MDIATALFSMEGKTIKEVQLEYVDDAGETLTITFTDGTTTKLFADEFRSKQ